MKRLIFAAALALSACNNPAPAPVAAIESILGQPTPELRKEATIKKIKAVCPVPLTNDELEWTAQFVEENRSRGAAWIAGKLWEKNEEIRKCRGLLSMRAGK